jgi:homoserine O-acetyltransferase
MAAAALALLAAAVLAMPAAGAAPEPREGDFRVREFRFQDGAVLPELRLHYTTLGAPHRGPDGKVDNAVLLLHGTTGTGRNYLAPGLAAELFGPGQALDPARYYVILPDGLGRGGSSKPSDGLRARFPRYGYGDVVAAQHLLVTQGLGVDHLRLVLGTSMGGMQTWMWGERYPDAMDALMPIASLPVQISGRNLLWRRILTESIRRDPDWRGGEYARQPTHWLAAAPLFNLMADGAVHLQAQAPTHAGADALYERLLAAAGNYDANDFLYWFESSWDYDPEPDLGRIKAPLLAVNFADDQINPAELGILEPLAARVPRGRAVVVPAGPGTLGHQTLARAAVWKPYLEELLRSLP